MAVLDTAGTGDYAAGGFWVRGWTVKYLKYSAFVGAALLAAGVAQAVDLGYSGRVGAMAGGYNGELSIRVTETEGGASQSGSLTAGDEWKAAYGIPLGFTMAIDDFFVDLGLELMQVEFDGDDLKRTDILLTSGYFIGDRWSLFVGFRKGMQGDGFFDSETFDEQGFFVGGGVGGIEAGPLLLNASLAYNLSKVDDYPPGQELDYDGLSLKFSGSLAGAPQHSLELRYQRFSGDDALNFVGSCGPGVLQNSSQTADSCRLDFELTESYLQLSYIYRFVF